MRRVYRLFWEISADAGDHVEQRASIQAVIEKRLRRRDVASQLDLSGRQVQRLMNRYRESGAAGLTDAGRGKPETWCAHKLVSCSNYRADLSTGSGALHY